MKRFRLLAGIIGALLVAILALPWIVSAEQFRPVIQRQLQSALGRPVEFGQLSLSLFPPSLHAQGLNIPGLATAELVRVRVKALPLLSGNLEIEAISLTRPAVEYRAGSPASSAPAPRIAALEIIDGKLIANGSEYTHIDVSIRTTDNQTSGSASWKNATLPVNLTFAATNSAGVWSFSALDATMGQIVAAFAGAVDTNANTVNGRLTIKPTPLDGLPIQSAYKPKGTVTAEVRITGPLRDPALTGAVQIANLEVSGGKLTQTLRASALGLAITPTRIVASPFSLQAGPTLVEASFQLTNYKTVDATISTKNAAIQNLLAIAGVDAVSGTGSATLQLRATGPLANPQLSGSGSIANADLHSDALIPNLKIDTAQIQFEADSASISNATFHIGKSNWQGIARWNGFRNPRIAIALKVDRLSNSEIQSWFPPAKSDGGMSVSVTGNIAVGKMLVNDLVLENLTSGIAFHDQLLTLDPLAAMVYNGKLSGAATVNMKVQPAVFHLNTHLERIDSEQLLAATTPLRRVITGPLTAEARLHFSPKPGEDFARTLTGTLQFQLAQGKLLPLNLLGEMSALGKFLKPLNANTANTPFLGMKGQFKLNNGAAETDDLRLDLDRGAALITGSLNLADQTLNLRMLTTLNKQFSDEVGGTRIGGFLSAAMASPKGELLMPSLIKGTFSKPVIGPDAVTLGRMKLGQPQDFQQGVQGILDLFKGKKKQP